MKMREFQLDKLDRARALQKEAAALHIPMPVLSWEFEVKDKNLATIEKGVGKANSYTRNGLNMMSWFAGMTAQSLNTASFGDGFLSVKDTAGTIHSFNTSNNIGRYPSTDVSLYLGTGTAETLDDYALPSYACATSIGSTFNSASRKLITIISGAYQNTIGSAINITEAGLRQMIQSNVYGLLFHDIFDAIAVPDGGTIVWTYVTEVAYPNL